MSIGWNALSWTSIYYSRFWIVLIQILKSSLCALCTLYAHVVQPNEWLTSHRIHFLFESPLIWDVDFVIVLRKRSRNKHSPIYWHQFSTTFLCGSDELYNVWQHICSNRLALDILNSLKKNVSQVSYRFKAWFETTWLLSCDIQFHYTTCMLCQHHHWESSG